VADPLCDWNDGIFTIETTEVSRAGGDADFIALMAALAVLVSGHRSATQLARAGLVAGDDARRRWAWRTGCSPAPSPPGGPDGF
jgi:hypothetical protein